MPCLLLKDWGIVKSVEFGKKEYIGCPINAVRVFNNNDVDELVLLDIGATPGGLGPRVDVIAQITEEAFMPITVGGGIRSLEDIRRLLRAAADKVAVNTHAIENPQFIREAARAFGSQCIVVSIDARRRREGGFDVYTRCGRRRIEFDAVTTARMVQDRGAGEILLNSIDRDGTWTGYDLELIESVSRAVDIPVVACGGAGSLRHFRDALVTGNASAIAAGSFFLFHGKRRGILITYPTEAELVATLGRDRVRPRAPAGPRLSEHVDS